MNVLCLLGEKKTKKKNLSTGTGCDRLHHLAEASSFDPYGTVHTRNNLVFGDLKEIPNIRNALRFPKTFFSFFFFLTTIVQLIKK